MVKTVKDKKHAEMIKSWVRNRPYCRYKFEVPFNYFGNRGFVDLVSDRVNLYSFKTEIVDLGETLRQFNRMKEFYPKYARLRPSDCATYLIVFDSFENIRIFSQFREMFGDINVIFYLPRYDFESPVSECEKYHQGKIIRMFMEKDKQLDSFAAWLLTLCPCYNQIATWVLNLDNTPFLITGDFLIENGLAKIIATCFKTLTERGVCPESLEV